MSDPSLVDTVKQYYADFLAKNRTAFEAALTETFRFSSPVDDHIDKAAFFERCWPNADKIAQIEVEEVAMSGDRAFVRYVGRRAVDGTRFRNVEVMTLVKGKLDAVEVYFGRDLDPRPGK